MSDSKIVGQSLSSAILFSEMTPPPAWEDDFNRWYDQEHIPLRMAVPGFRSAQRYRATDGAGYLAVYEMETLAVLKTPAYTAVKNAPSERTRRMLGGVSGFTRYLAESIAEHRPPSMSDDDVTALEIPYLYAVFFRVPAERRGEFNDWYAQDHVPILLECEDWRCIRRFEITDGEPEPWSHLTLHYLADKRALDSPARARARATPWRARLAQEHWFNAATYRVFETRGARQWAAR
jgi:hypothetical protein